VCSSDLPKTPKPQSRKIFSYFISVSVVIAHLAFICFFDIGVLEYFRLSDGNLIVSDGANGSSRIGLLDNISGACEGLLGPCGHHRAQLVICWHLNVAICHFAL